MAEENKDKKEIEIPIRGANISFYATPKVLDVKTRLFYKYGNRAFSRYVSKAIAEKEERDGGTFIDMDEVEHK